MLIARAVTVRLAGKTILPKVNFTARPGEVTAIVGPNGSGKSTLLRAVAGDLPHGGSITLNGQPINAMPLWHLAELRAVLPQSASLAFPFTVREVVRLGLIGLLATLPHRAALVDAALARVGLAGYAGRYFGELSGGEAQRVQLARVLLQVWNPVEAGIPRWLILDEPVASLDIGHQLVIMRLAQDFARAGGGVIAVMHDLNLTAMFADAVALMQQGRVLAAGPIAEVFTDARLSKAYGCALRINTAPPRDGLFILPQVVVPQAAA